MKIIIEQRGIEYIAQFEGREESGTAKDPPQSAIGKLIENHGEIIGLVVEKRYRKHQYRFHCVELKTALMPKRGELQTGTRAMMAILLAEFGSALVSAPEIASVVRSEGRKFTNNVDPYDYFKFNLEALVKVGAIEIVEGE